MGHTACWKPKAAQSVVKVLYHLSSHTLMFWNWSILKSLRPSDTYMRQWSHHHWFRWWLVAWSAPSHYLNQCWSIVNRTLRNKHQWNFNRNSSTFIQENALENVVCEMAATLFQPQCVKKTISILQLLTNWLCVSPGYQQPWHWLSRSQSL